jgi:hypothetical protein
MIAKTFVAERKLLYALKGRQARTPLTVRVSAPVLVEEGTVDFQVAGGTAVCTVEFQGLGEDSIKEYGADSIQALSLAVNIDRYLSRMKKKYDFYFPNGEPYFGDA